MKIRRLRVKFSPHRRRSFFWRHDQAMIYICMGFDWISLTKPVSTNPFADAAAAVEFSDILHC